MSPHSTVNTSRARNAAMGCLTKTGRRFMSRSPTESWNVQDDEVDELDPDERDDQAADAVDPQVPAEHGRRRRGPVPDTAQGQRDQRDDDQSVEDNRRGDGRV